MWVIENWAEWLDADLRRELLVAVDTITEERRARFMGRGPTMAPR